MHCDVLRPELPVAGFLLVVGLVALAGERRPPRRRARLFWGGGATLVALTVLTLGAVSTVSRPNCPAPPAISQTLTQRGPALLESEALR